MLHRTLCPLCVHPKWFQLLPIRTLGKFVALYIVFVKFVFLIALNFDNEIDSKLGFSSTAFMSNNMFFYFVHVGRSFSTTFTPLVRMRALSSIALARGTMVVARVEIACHVASLGFFKPTFPW